MVSSLRDAGEGVWTEEELPEGLVFGPYEGVKNNSTKTISPYMWTVISIFILTLYITRMYCF